MDVDEWPCALYGIGNPALTNGTVVNGLQWVFRPSDTLSIYNAGVTKMHHYYRLTHDFDKWIHPGHYHHQCVCQIREQSIALATFTLRAAASFDKIPSDLRIPGMWLRTRIITSTAVYLNRHKTAFEVRLLWVNDNIPQATMGCTLI